LIIYNVELRTRQILEMHSWTFRFRIFVTLRAFFDILITFSTWNRRRAATQNFSYFFRKRRQTNQIVSAIFFLSILW